MFIFFNKNGKRVNIFKIYWKAEEVNIIRIRGRDSINEGFTRVEWLKDIREVRFMFKQFAYKEYKVGFDR